MSSWNSYVVRLIFVAAASVAVGFARGDEAAGPGEPPQPEPPARQATRYSPVTRADPQRPGSPPIFEHVSVDTRQAAKERALAEKQLQLQQLQHEIHQLQHELGQNRQILLQLKLIECPLDDELPTIESILNKMDEAAGRKDMDDDARGGMCRVFESSRAMDTIVATLQQAKQIKILAEPSLVTVNGRPASLRVGGELPRAQPGNGESGSVEFPQLGTRLDVLPRVSPDGNVRVELKLEVRDILDPAQRAVVDAGIPQAVRTRAVNTTLEMQNGHTMVLGGMVQRSDGIPGNTRPPTALLLMLTSEIIDPMAHVAPPSPVPVIR